MKKINLAENLLRFGVKNLDSRNVSKLKRLVEQSDSTTPTERIPLGNLGLNHREYWNADGKQYYSILMYQTDSVTNRGDNQKRIAVSIDIDKTKSSGTGEYILDEASNKTPLFLIATPNGVVPQLFGWNEYVKHITPSGGFAGMVVPRLGKDQNTRVTDLNALESVKQSIQSSIQNNTKLQEYGKKLFT
jgi:hypothetical protein